MTDNISELVDEPELIDAADDITLDRWTKYGHDRLYINGGRVEPYIDLEDGSLGDTGMVRVNAEFDDDTVTVEIGDEDGNSRHDVIAISLSGDVDDEDDEGAQDSEDQSKNVADPTPEHVEEVGYNEAAGQAQQAEAQRLFSDGGEVQVEDGEEDEQATDEAEESERNDASEHMFASDDSECRRVDCDETPEMAAECDTGQTKYYCGEHAGGRQAGHARVEEWREL